MDDERDPELLDDLAAIVLEALLERADRLPAEGVVEPDRDDLLVPEHPGRIFPERVHVLTRGEARADEPLWTLALREVVGGVYRIEAGNALRLDVRDEGVGDVREDDAARHVHVVGLDQLAEPG